MTGVLLLIVLAITGGVIAYLGDKLGQQNRKKTAAAVWSASPRYQRAHDYRQRRCGRYPHHGGPDGYQQRSTDGPLWHEADSAGNP